MSWKHVLAGAGAVAGAVLSSVAVSIATEVQARNELLVRCERDGGTYIVDASQNRFTKNQKIDCSHFTNGHYCHVVNAFGDKKIKNGQMTVLGLITPNFGSGNYPTARISLDYTLARTGPATYKKIVNFIGRPLGLKGIVDSVLDMDGMAYVNCYTV